MKSINHIVILFGATGDLARLKILSGLQNLVTKSKLPGKLTVWAIGRREMDTAGFVNYLANVQPHPLQIDTNVLNLEYLHLDFDSGDGFNPLWQKLQGEQMGTQIAMFMSVGPDVLANCMEHFQQPEATRIIQNHGVKIIIEKPFGENLDSALNLNAQLNQIFGAERIYRNDHYLHKDTVRGISQIRHEDLELSEMLTNQHITEIKFVAREKVGLGTRAHYFEGRGMTIDWVQSHMLQILALTCATDISPNHKAEFIRSLSVVPGSVRRAQYQGYLESEGVPANSSTETYIQFALYSSLSQWKGVKFSLETGKAFAEKEVSLTLTLKQFDAHYGQNIVLGIEPPGGHRFLAELTGQEYEDVFVQVFAGHISNFVTMDEIIAQWKLTAELQAHTHQTAMESYPQGATGFPITV